MSACRDRTGHCSCANVGTPCCWCGQVTWLDRVRPHAENEQPPREEHTAYKLIDGFCQPKVGPIRRAMESITDEVMEDLVADAIEKYDERAKVTIEIWRLRALGLGDQWQPIWTMPSNGEWFIVSDGEFTTTAWVEPTTKKLNLLAEPDCWGEAFIWCKFPKVPRLDR